MGVRSLIIPFSSTPPPPPQNGGLLVVPPNNYNISLLLGARSSSSSCRRHRRRSLASSVVVVSAKNISLLLGARSSSSSCRRHRRRSLASSVVVVSAKKSSASDEEEPKTKRKQNLFESVTEALDFSQVRSAEDAQLLEEAREATKSGNKMTREQYGALRRKIGGTYKDFFKSYIEADGEYLEEGWVDKTCKVCKKDTRGEARQVDNFGRYVHVACLDKKSKSGGNFFTRLFS